MAAGIMAIVIFVAMFILIVWDKIERHLVTLGCGLLTLIFVFGVGMHSGKAVMDTLNFKSIATTSFWYAAGESAEESSGINWATIIFIAGMMIMVEGMAKAGFFRWLCMKIAKLVNFKPIPIFVTFMILSAFLAMFIDSITVILFLAAVTIELAQMLKFNPIPVILTEIFCANLGGSATMCGDPPNIIIGTSLGYSFSDFVTNTGVIAAISLVVVVIYFFFTVRKEIIPADRNEKDIKVDTNIKIDNKFSFISSCVIFLVAIVMLVTHAMTGLTVAFIGVVVAAATLIFAGKGAVELLKKVDYKTLLFFVGLFIVVGGLEQTGILEILADFIEKITGGNPWIMIAVILWLSAIASAFVDNIPFAATMVPVIVRLASTSNIALGTLSWTLALGTDIGGSATPIGASANVVGIAVASKEGYMIGWGKYCKTLAPATIIVMVISMLSIYARYL